MAKIDLNPMFDGVHGKLNRIVYKKYRGRTIMGPMPERAEEFSDAQLAHQERWQRAVDFGNAVLANPELSLLYSEAGKELDINPFALCIADYFNNPEVTLIDGMGYNGQAGGTIEVQTRDDFGVVKVEVVLTHASDGRLIERGWAVEVVPEKGVWSYTATQAAPAGITVAMQATAFDRPGGTGMQVLTKDI